MKSFFNWLTIVAAIIMIITILVQQRSSSLGASFGGDSNFYRSKRGAEKIIFNMTIVSAVVFALAVVLSLLSKG